MRKLNWGRLAFGLACFAVPVVMLAVVCACCGVYPFGPTSFLSEDLGYQYRDFYEWFIRVLGGQASVLYNANTGMGTNAWGIYSYYLASPVNLLLPLFGREHIELFVYFATSLKLGCMSLTTTWYLRRRFGIDRLLSLALATCFVMSTWTVTQMRNPQWIDALVLLPLMGWATFVLVRNNRRLPLIVVVAAAVVACWYSAYMLLAFLFLLFVMEAVVATVPDATSTAMPGDGSAGAIPVKALLARAGWLVVCVAVGLALSAFTFVPTVLQMLGTNASSTALMPKNLPLDTVVQGTVLLGFLPDKTPQLFGGTLLLVLVFALPFVRRVPVRVRVVALLAVLFMIYGTKGATIQLAWSGFRPTMGFYCRMSWLAIFSLVWAGAWVVRALQDHKDSLRVLIVGACVACAWGVLVFVTTAYDDALALAGMVLVAVCAATSLAFATKRSGSAARQIGGVALCLIVFGELLWSSYACMVPLYPASRNEEAIADSIRETREQLAELSEHDNSWYRADKTYTRIGYAVLSEAMAFGYNSLSSYCSSQNGRAVAFVERMGYCKEDEFSISYTSAIPAMDALLGVRYVSTGQCPAGYEDIGLMEVDATEPSVFIPRSEPLQVKARFFENPLALSLAYGVSDQAVGASYVGTDDPFDEQNALYSRLLGREVALYVPMQADLVEQTDTKCAWEVHVPAGYVGYVRTKLTDIPSVLTVGDHPYDDNMRWRHAVTEVADAREGEQTVRVSLEYSIEVMNWSEPPEPLDPSDLCRAYALDWSAYEQVMAELAQKQASVERCDAGHVELAYQAEADGTLLVSMPYESGWTAKVNGQTVELQSAYEGALMLVPVTQGMNHVELSFVSPGLVAGCAVSAATLVGLIVACVVARRNEGK